MSILARQRRSDDAEPSVHRSRIPLQRVRPRYRRGDSGRLYGAVGGSVVLLALLLPGLVPNSHPFGAGDPLGATAPSKLARTASFGSAQLPDHGPRNASFSSSTSLNAPVSESTVFLRNGTNATGLVPAADCPSPGQLAFIASQLYVACGHGYGTLEVLDPSSFALRKSFAPPLMFNPAFGFDPATNCLYISALNVTGGLPHGQIDILNLTTGAFAGEFPSDPTPHSFTFDPANGLFYVVASEIGYLDIVDPISRSVSQVTVGAIGAPAVDSATGNLILPDPGASTIRVFSPSVGAITATRTVGLNPSAVFYDPSVGRLYVANTGGSNLTVLNATTLQSVASIPVGQGPNRFAYDPTNGSILVTNSGSRNVSIVNDTTDRVVANVATGQLAPDGAVFVPSSPRFIVADSVGENLSVIDARTQRLVGSTRLGAQPGALLPDTPKHRWLVADLIRPEVSVYNASTQRLLNSIPLNQTAVGMALDPRSGTVLVAESTDAELLDASLQRVTSRIALVGGPGAVIYDLLDDAFFLIDQGTQGNVTMINASTLSIAARIPVGGYPYSVSFDPYADRVLVGTLEGLNVTASPALDVIDPVHRTLVSEIRLANAPYASLADVADQRVYVTDGGDLLALNATTLSSLGTVTVPNFSPVDLAYSSVTTELFASNGGSVIRTFPSIAPRVSYALEAGDEGTQFQSFAVDSSRNTILVSDVGNGTLNLLAMGPILGPVQSTPDPVVVGQLVALSASVLVGVPPYDYGFLGLAIQLTNCSVQFLPVRMVCTASTPGTYPINISVQDASGLTAEVNGSLSVLPQPTFPVHFEETGLPSPTRWSVTLAGRTNTSNSSSIGFRVGEGTVSSFEIAPVRGFTASPPFGSVSVQTQAVTVGIVFTANRSSTAPGPPSVTLTFTPNPVEVGASVEIVATVVGGVSPIGFQYYHLPTGCATANTSEFSCRPTVAMTARVQVVVTDADGQGLANATLTVTASNGPPPVGQGPGTTTTTWEWIGGIALASVLGLGGIGFVLVHRRRRRSPEAHARGSV